MEDSVVGRGMGGLGERTLIPWRLIVSEPGAGAWNMAVDEALFESVRAGGAPFLRFYRWSPATLSLGRFQNLSSGLTAAAGTKPRVRRLTGGGGIWHDDELTYSLGCRQEHLDVAGVKPSFERLCGFLLDAWRTLGWDASFAKDASKAALGAYSPACFAGSEEYDVLVGGRKLGGNAQKRDRLNIFQHGSIPFRLHHADLAELFLPGFRPQPELTTDLVSSGWSGTRVELQELLARSFQNRLGAALREDSLSTEEAARARALTDHYCSEEWTTSGGGSLRPD